MKKFTPEIHHTTAFSALKTLRDQQQLSTEGYGAYIGLDVHKDIIAVAIALPGRSQAYFHREVGNKPKSVEKLVLELSTTFGGQALLFCYEAGPCGYVLYHQLTALGHDCDVVAPSKIPYKTGEKVKTDRLDARKLAQYLRAGELTSVWVPDTEQEAMRDLTRARNDMKDQERKARQQLNAFVLRHGHPWPSGKTRWTRAHYNWLESLTFKHPWQQVTLQEYVNAAKAATDRVSDMTKEIDKAAQTWCFKPVVDSLIALRGIDTLAAIILLSELGDISRFDNPKQLMAFLGLVPSEHSSGKRRRQGSITLTGNGYARRILVESAWTYRFPARQTMHLKRKAANATDEAKAIAWKAQKRLCGRYHTLIQAGKNQKTVSPSLLG